MEKGEGPTHSEIAEILAESMNVPSGDNTQPWRFRVGDGYVDIFNIENGDPTLYNFRERGSYFAHGALAENISVAAAHRGFAATVRPFPGEPQCTAHIAFARAERSDSSLYPALAQRTTNRKRYENKPLAPKHRQALINVVQQYPIVLRLVEDKAAIETLSKVISTNEYLLMENRATHDFLFNIIRWSEAQAREDPGLYLMTMEFPPPVRFLMRHVLRHWAAVQFLNLFGLSRAISKQSAADYACSSALGAVIFQGERDEDFFTAGRAFERVWLTATVLGISIQPVTALPYLLQRVRAGEAQAYTPQQQARIEEANTVIAEKFGLQNSEHIAMLFRLGYGEPPTARSFKLPPRFVS